MEICVVQLAEDLTGLDLAECDLFFDVVEYHQEVLALLGISGIVVRHGDDRAVVLHDDCG